MYTAWVQLLARDFRGSAEECRRALAVEPGFALGRSFLGLALSLQGAHADGLDELRTAAAQDEVPLTFLFLQHGYALAGERAKAAHLERRIRDMVGSHYLCFYEVGQANAIMGEMDEAFRWLDKALEQRSECMVWLEVEPWMDDLRGDERYHGIVERAGLARR